MALKESNQLNFGIPAIVEKTNFVKLGEIPAWVYELKESKWKPEEIIISEPLSYCAGVVRADEGIEDMFSKYPSFYLYHAPIHNDTKLNEWESRGAILIHNAEELKDIGDESPVYLSAHGVGLDVWEILKQKRAKGKDSTCPLVDKTHREVRDLVARDYEVLMFGNKNHDEIVGTLTHAPDKIHVISPNVTDEEIRRILANFEHKKIGIRSQTTLNYQDISAKIALIKQLREDVDLPKTEDICYASQNRQEAVTRVITEAGAQLMIIFGSDETKRQPSSNTIRLREVAIESGVLSAHIVEDISEINAQWFSCIKKVGISAGASADPKRVAEMLAALYDVGVSRNQVKKLTVAVEPQVFSAARDFDFSK